MAGAARGLLRRVLLRALVVNVGVLVIGVAPAAADAARPTNYRSTVTGVTPAEPDVDADVTGGDSFLRMRVAPGHVVVVLGYEDEPYLRIDTDGSVDENLRSPASWLNRKRFGSTSPLPDDVDATAAPNWRRIGNDGVALWHDHRVHWMSLGELSRLIETFQAEGVTRAVMAGQVKHTQIFSSIRRTNSLMSTHSTLMPR